MIALLTGRVDSLQDGSCILDVNGVGYLVQASSRTLAALPQAPAITRLLIETHVREDAIQLYGFADSAERDWFRLLTTVQGVGAKVALSVLSALSPRDLIGAIAAGDKAGLTRAPGVGPRLAVRLLTELRDKAGAMPSSSGVAMPATARPATVADDALSALVNLGYRRAEAQGAIAKVIERQGLAVHATDLADRGYGQGGVDFLATAHVPAGCQAIVTNPPYGDGGAERGGPASSRMLLSFVKHAIGLTEQCDGQLALLVRFTWMAGKRASSLMSAGPLDRVIVLTKRIRWFDMGDATKQGQHHHAWLFFDAQRDRAQPPAIVFG